ncbi:MAG: 16S rRNA (cytidine(1402)-2'-O)-methyltransferase [Proteobacteria bacterium]|nr:16S rRNA (cytidine(1402)-2'-O)-methyltransferase [Pseudomonadota bacterium]
MMTGCLYVVSTPIGNLADITLRALEILKSVNWIAAEDTRHSVRLLDFYHIHTPLISLHEHNEKQRIAEWIPQLHAGKNIALISDAGTPLISDPGYDLIQAAHQAGIQVSPIPGACAAIAALSVAGLPTDRFIFEGFLPSKTAARLERLQALIKETSTIIFYEAPHRIVDLIQQLTLLFGGQRSVTICRELTKKFETVHQDQLASLEKWLSEDSHRQKGEFVVIVQGAQAAESSDLEEIKHLLKTLLEELPLKQAVKLTSKITHSNKNFVYDLALQLTK